MARLVLIGSALLVTLCLFAKEATALISPGSKLPNLDLNWGFNPLTKVNIQEYISGQSVLIVGVPGAFTPTATNVQVPTYFEHQDTLKQLGIENVIIYSVNDSAVVGIWNKQLVEAYGKPNTLVTFMADPTGDFTRACGMELKQTPELTNKGLLGRCKQFAMYVENNVVKTVLVSEGQGDPTGYINPDATSAKAMIQAIQSVKNFELY